MLILSFPVYGLEAAAIVLVPKSVYAVLAAYRTEVSVGFAVVALLMIYLFVKKLVAEYRQSPESASAFATARDRSISDLQFWCIMVVSLALPWIAAGYRHLTR